MTSWTAAVRVLQDGSVEFTSKGSQALDAMFLLLDADQSGGLSLDEMRLYFMLTEKVELSKSDFAGMGLQMLETNPSEISPVGFKEIYRCIYENSVEQGDERLHKDLMTFGIDTILRATDAASLLMRPASERKPPMEMRPASERKPSIDATSLLMRPASERKPSIDATSLLMRPTSERKPPMDATSLLMRPASERKPSMDATKAESIERKAKRKDPSSAPASSSKRKPTGLAPLPFAFTSRKTPSPETTSDSGDMVIDLTSSTALQTPQKGVIMLIDSPQVGNDSTTEQTTLEVVPKKAIHPFFLQQQQSRLQQQSKSSTKSDVNDMEDPDETSGKIPSYIRNLHCDREFPPPNLSFPFASVPLKHLPSFPQILKPTASKNLTAFQLPNHSSLWKSSSSLGTPLLKSLTGAISSPILVIEDEESRPAADIVLHDEDDEVVMISENQHEIVEIQDDLDTKRVAWTEKYRPRSSKEVLGNPDAVAELRSWLTAWLVEKSRTDSEISPSDASESEVEDPIDDGDEDWENSGDEGTAAEVQGTKKSMILYGPNGAGKTCSLYTVASELGFRVFEVNASDDRSKIKQLVGEASQSYGLSKSGRSLELPLILVDEFESGFDDDVNFLTAVKSLIRTARAPVVFICDDVLPKQISANGKTLDYRALTAAEVLRFERPPVADVARRLQEVAEKERLGSFKGKHVGDIYGSCLELAQRFHGDLRACLQSLHFWNGFRLDQQQDAESSINSTRIIAFEKDGLDEAIRPVWMNGATETVEMKPRKLNRADEAFEVTGRFSFPDLPRRNHRVLVCSDDGVDILGEQVYECVERGEMVQTDSTTTLIQGCRLVLNKESESDSNDDVKSNKEDLNDRIDEAEQSDEQVNKKKKQKTVVSDDDDDEDDVEDEEGYPKETPPVSKTTTRTTTTRKKKKNRRVVLDDDDDDEDVFESGDSDKAGSTTQQSSLPHTQQDGTDERSSAVFDQVDDPDFEPLRQGSHRRLRGEKQQQQQKKLRLGSSVAKKARRGYLDEFFEEDMDDAGRRRLRMNLVVESVATMRIRIVEAGQLVQIKQLMMRISSDDLISRRFNSLYWCLNPSSLPSDRSESKTRRPALVVESGDIPMDDSGVTVEVDLDKAKRNAAALSRLAREKDLEALADCVSLNRRGPIGDRKGSHQTLAIEGGSYSSGDLLGVSLARFLLGSAPLLNVEDDTQRSPEDLKLEHDREEYIQSLKEHQLRIDYQQPTKALWEDIPMYIRMCRLDEMRRVVHSGRRRFASYFSSRGGMDWLNASSAAKLGLKDDDLGWEPLVKEHDDRVGQEESRFVELK